MRNSVVDLFCGIGGLSYGFVKEGFSVVAGLDSDESCRFAYESNVGGDFISADLRTVKGKALANFFPTGAGRKILIGCAPCQPFSIYTGRYKKARRRDGQWRLLDDFARVVRATKPDVISMENVPRVTRHPVFSKFCRALEAAGYVVTYQNVRAEDYGVPQRRHRLVLFASKFGKVTLVNPTHRGKARTVRDAIGHLPTLKAGERSPADRFHASRGLSEKNLARLRATAPGGSWRDWDPELRLKCHGKASGRSFRSVYGRMAWDAPSPVITTQCLGIGNGRFGHPSQDRAVSIREAALLQSFPATFKLAPPRRPVSGVAIARQIGNAVPPQLARAIARTIRRHLVLHDKSERQSMA